MIHGPVAAHPWDPIHVDENQPAVRFQGFENGGCGLEWKLEMMVGIADECHVDTVGGQQAGFLIA